jgi:hypothetical protein
MTRTLVAPSTRRRFVRVLVATLVVLGAARLAAPVVPALAAGDARAVTKPLADSNTALLARAALGAARHLVAQVPLTPGARVGLRPEGDGKLDADMREALLQALNARSIHCVLLPPLGGVKEAGTPARTAADSGAEPTITAPPLTLGDGAGDLAGLAARSGPQATATLREERAAQAARADSLARLPAGGAAAGVSLLATPGDLPVLTWRVQEARVDYVRQFRGGLLGAHRVERRARADLALRLTPAGSNAVSWSAAADSTVGDVVLKSELSALEDRTRPETRPQLPQSSYKKVLEPVLVVVLVAGLVSLFYQNRP